MSLSTEDRQAIIEYRIERALETFLEAKYVAAGNFWNLAANRLYYSVYYACVALLLKSNISTTSHAGVIRMMNLHFVRSGILDMEEGKLLKRLFRMRQTGDYDDLNDWGSEDILPYMESTENLINKLISLVR